MKKFFTYLALIITGTLLPVAPAFADNTQQDDSKCVSTSIIQNADGKYCDDGGGGGVWAILNIGLTVLTFGVGIAATAGLVICGIKYATSGTNEAQATNARRRIFEIVIGLIAYAVLYAALNWLIPGFSTADTSMTAANSPYKTTRASTPDNSSNSNISSTNKSSQKSTSKTSQNTAKAAEAREVAKFQKVIQKYTWPKYGTHPNTWKNGSQEKGATKKNSKPYGIYLGFNYSQGEKDCGAYVAAMLKSSGLAKGLNMHKKSGYFFTEYFKNSSQWEEIPESAIKKDIAKGGNGNSLLKPGDVIIFRNGKASWHYKSNSKRNSQHAIIYIGKIPGYTYRFAEASWGSFTGTSARSYHSSMKRIYADYYSPSNMKLRPTVHVYHHKA